MVSLHALLDEPGGVPSHRKRLRVLNSEHRYVDSRARVGSYGGPVSQGEHTSEGRDSFRGYFCFLLLPLTCLLFYLLRSVLMVFFTC